MLKYAIIPHIYLSFFRRLKSLFLNVTNHKSSTWQQKQINAANVYGEIVDYPYPQLHPSYTTDDIARISREELTKILAMKPTACLVAGEWTLTFQLVDGLLRAGVKVLASCSERKTVEQKNPDGSLTKTAHFDFVQFREYEYFRRADREK